MLANFLLLWSGLAFGHSLFVSFKSRRSIFCVSFCYLSPFISTQSHFGLEVFKEDFFLSFFRHKNFLCSSVCVPGSGTPLDSETGWTGDFLLNRLSKNSHKDFRPSDYVRHAQGNPPEI